jgi:hypothetical protein
LRRFSFFSDGSIGGKCVDDDDDVDVDVDVDDDDIDDDVARPKEVMGEGGGVGGRKGEVEKDPTKAGGDDVDDHDVDDDDSVADVNSLDVSDVVVDIIWRVGVGTGSVRASDARNAAVAVAVASAEWVRPWP